MTDLAPASDWSGCASPPVSLIGAEARPPRMDEVAVDFGIVLVALEIRSGRVRAMRDDRRLAWLEFGRAVAAAPPPAATTTVETMTRLPRHNEVSGGTRLAARIALGRAAVAGRLGFAESLRLVRATHRAAVGPATPAEAGEMLTAVRTIAPLAPFRVRTLDITVAALLMLRARRRTARFCFGATVDPVRTHAWLQIDGIPVNEADWVSRYTPFPPT